VQELFADVHMWDGAAASGPRAHARPEGASAPPSRNPSAAATQSDQTRRSGGSA
jgi:hypothetical protein